MGPGTEFPENFLVLNLFHVREAPFLKREGSTEKSNFVLLLKWAGV